MLEAWVRTIMCALAKGLLIEELKAMRICHALQFSGRLETVWVGLSALYTNGFAHKLNLL